MPQPVIFFLNASVGHRGHTGPLLRKTEIVRSTGRPSGSFHGLRPVVVRTAVSEIKGRDFQSYKLLRIFGKCVREIVGPTLFGKVRNYVLDRAEEIVI